MRFKLHPGKGARLLQRSFIRVLGFSGKFCHSISLQADVTWVDNFQTISSSECACSSVYFFSCAALRVLLTPGAVPAVFCCRMGKDRTGVMSALVQRLCGIPRERIVRDYSLTEVRLCAVSREEIERGERDGKQCSVKPLYLKLFTLHSQTSLRVFHYYAGLHEGLPGGYEAGILWYRSWRIFCPVATKDDGKLLRLDRQHVSAQSSRSYIFRSRSCLSIKNLQLQNVYLFVCLFVYRYESVEGYMTSIGFTEEEQNRLKQILSE